MLQLPARFVEVQALLLQLLDVSMRLALQLLAAEPSLLSWLRFGLRLAMLPLLSLLLLLHVPILYRRRRLPLQWLLSLHLGLVPLLLSLLALLPRSTLLPPAVTGLHLSHRFVELLLHLQLPLGAPVTEFRLRRLELSRLLMAQLGRLLTEVRFPPLAALRLQVVNPCQRPGCSSYGSCGCRCTCGPCSRSRFCSRLMQGGKVRAAATPPPPFS